MANNINTARTIAQRIARGERDFGRVAVKEDGCHLLLNYTTEAQYSGDFTEVEKACRGLVIRDDGKIAALPFPKFFNLGEPQCPPLPDEPYAVYEKIDGSLIIAWYDGDNLRFNTRGSFDNEYRTFAKEWFEKRATQLAMPHHWTLMFEVCLDNDDMPRAAYKPEGLYLLAIRDNYSGVEMSFHDTRMNEFGLAHLPRAAIYQESIDEVAKKAKEAEGVEGWVIRFVSGLRVKVKTTWYVRLFRAIQQCTPKHIRELMLDSGVGLIDEFPDDLRPLAVEIADAIQEQLQAELECIYAAYAKVAGIETRKDFALTVLNGYPAISSYLFRLRDGKFDESDVLRKMELTNEP